jgi:hypothetical protein
VLARIRTFTAGLGARLRQGLPARPAAPDLVLAAGAVSLTAVLLFIFATPVTLNLRKAVAASAVKGNAATLQLAVESCAAANLGVYPRDVQAALRWLPRERAPRNPVTGRPVEFTGAPGDLTYRCDKDGRGYVIEAWDPFRADPVVLVRLQGRSADPAAPEGLR